MGFFNSFFQQIFKRTTTFSGSDAKGELIPSSRSPIENSSHHYICLWTWNNQMTSAQLTCYMTITETCIDKIFKKKVRCIVPYITLCMNSRRQHFNLYSTDSLDNLLCITYTLARKEQRRINLASLFKFTFFRCFSGARSQCAIKQETKLLDSLRMMEHMHKITSYWS